jgi:spore germination cell wall hydrolase CwlJ-like protein
MTKKYVLAGAIGAFLAAANIVYAPTIAKPVFTPPKSTIISGRENLLEKYAKENEERKKVLMKKIDDLENYKTEDFNEDSLEIFTARLMMGETEDYSAKDKIAVAFTILNRLKRGAWYGETFHEVALKPYQYSCFNPDRDSSIFLKIPLQHNERDFLINVQLSKNFWLGRYKDPTNGATHYYNPKKVKKPEWVKRMIFCRRIGDHLFYKER